MSEIPTVIVTKDDTSKKSYQLLNGEGKPLTEEENQKMINEMTEKASDFDP